MPRWTDALRGLPQAPASPLSRALEAYGIVPVLRLNAQYGERLTPGGLRQGTMVHFDGSTTDAGGVRYLNTSRFGYTWAVGDDGALVELEPPEHRTPHAGRCRTPLANSVFWGIAALTNEKVPCTPAQAATIARVLAGLWRHQHWGLPTPAALTARIRGHDEEAVFGPEHTKNRAKWGTGPRKIDPRGLPTGPVILDLARVREAVRAQLAA